MISSVGELLFNWAYSLGMGLAAALVLIGIPALIGTLFANYKKKKELLKIQQDRLQKQV